MTPLFQFVLSQPKAVASFLAERAQFTAPFEALFHRVQPDRLILLGSGSSGHAALMAQRVLQRATGLETNCINPCDAEQLHYCRAERPLYLALSQSGISTNVYTLAAQLRAEGKPVVALTESENTPVAKQALLALSLPVAEEQIGAKTKGVTLSALALMLLGLSVCEDPVWKNEMYVAIDRIGGAMEENLQAAMQWSRAQAPLLLPFSNLTVIGASETVGAVREGALKLLETSYLPVSWYPLDEYVHGIQNALDQSSALILLLPADGEDREKMLRLIAFAKSVGACCATIAAERGEETMLVLKSGRCSETASLDFLPALQTLAATLSQKRGIDTSKRRYPDFFSLMGSKMNA